jgi:hypothetical protein
MCLRAIHFDCGWRMVTPMLLTTMWVRGRAWDRLVSEGKQNRRRAVCSITPERTPGRPGAVTPKRTSDTERLATPDLARGAGHAAKRQSRRWQWYGEAAGQPEILSEKGVPD